VKPKEIHGKRKERALGNVAISTEEAQRASDDVEKSILAKKPEKEQLS
jgi:hypothetical protein